MNYASHLYRFHLIVVRRGLLLLPVPTVLLSRDNFFHRRIKPVDCITLHGRSIDRRKPADMAGARSTDIIILDRAREPRSISHGASRMILAPERDETRERGLSGAQETGNRNCSLGYYGT